MKWNVFDKEIHGDENEAEEVEADTAQYAARAWLAQLDTDIQCQVESGDLVFDLKIRDENGQWTTYQISGQTEITIRVSEVTERSNRG